MIRSIILVGTSPPSDTWRTFLSGLAPSGFPLRGHVARFPYLDFLRERHTALANITSGRSTYPIRICLSESLIKSKQVLLHHSDILPQPTIRRLQSERTGMMACHLLRSLTAAHRVMMALPPPWSHHDKLKSLGVIMTS